MLKTYAGAVLLAALASCTTLLEGTHTREHTHSERVVTVRDTVVYTPVDSATMKIVADVRALRDLIESLKRDGARSVRGTHNANLVMQVVNDTLHLEARCDSLAHVLEGALRTIEERTTQNTELTRTIQDVRADRKGGIPGWMQGTIWIVITVCALLLLLSFIVPKFLHRRL